MLRRLLRFTAALCLPVLLALGSSAVLGSCAARLGWGVVLWTSSEGPLPAGSVVPVYIKSNIEKLYVVGVPGVKDKKVELKLWQLELFPTRAKAIQRVKAMGPNVSLYMVAARDGLPVWNSPSNTAKRARVFRLREGQTVKVLEKTPDDATSAGGQAQTGSWYKVLADDGTIGFVLSASFHLYDESKEGPPVIASVKQPLSGRVDLVFSRTWRPEYFQEMIDDNRIDLDYFSLRFGLFVDAIRRQIRLELPGASQIFNYSSISEAKGLYVFDGSPLRIKLESDSRMVCYWGPEVTDDETPQADSGDSQPPASEPAIVPESVESFGSEGSAALVVLTAEARETVRLETLRHQQLLSAFIDEVGDSLTAADSGKLALGKNGRFTWVGRGEGIAATLLPEGAGEAGEVALRAYLDPSLASSWTGVISFRFDAVAAEKTSRVWTDFLYRATPAGLVLGRTSTLGLLAQAPDPQAATLILEPAAK